MTRIRFQSRTWISLRHHVKIYIRPPSLLSSGYKGPFPTRRKRSYISVQSRSQERLSFTTTRLVSLHGAACFRTSQRFNDDKVDTNRTETCSYEKRNRLELFGIFYSFLSNYLEDFNNTGTSTMRRNAKHCIWRSVKDPQHNKNS
jgi:hypothetical protein